MADKVKSAAEMAMARFEGEAIPEADLPESGERKEYEVEDFVITEQEKAPSHVVNQDDPDPEGFDIDKKSNRFKTDTQSFSRIKDVRCEGVEVLIEIDKTKLDLSIHAAVLTDQRITPTQAIERAIALNQMLMLDKVTLADRKQVEAIVEATMIAVLEAQENMMRQHGATYEDIKAARRARLDKIHMFEQAVKDKRGQAALDDLQELMLFKTILEKVNK